MLIVTASGKGGVGKTTTAAVLWGAARRAGVTVQLVNVDPQRSLAMWLPEAGVIHLPGVEKADDLRRVDRVDVLTIVDTPPGTAAQALAAWEAADVLIGCTGATTMELEGLADLAERLGGPAEIDLVAVGKFDGRANHGHGVVSLIRQRWGASKVVVFPARAEVPYAYDQRREIAMSSPVAMAGDDLLARVLELEISAPLVKGAAV
jgi:cellulose biosynthesis protein BcsQ